jgi:hypothetical protein
MNEFTELLKVFTTGSKTNLLFGVGLVLLVLSALAPKIKLPDVAARWCRIIGAPVFALGLIGNLVLWAMGRQIAGRQLMVEYLPVILVGALAIFAFFSQLQIRRRLTQLKEAEDQLVSSVEDATRHVLKGIPQIFDRAYQLIKQADKELWIISFTLDFGEVHSHIPAIANVYNKMPVSEAYKTSTKKRRRNMAADVKDLAETLKQKVVTIPRVHILTLCNDDIQKNFLEPLAGRPKYKDIFTEAKKNEVYGLIQQAKQKIVARIIARDPTPNEDEEFVGRMFEVHRLPIQLFIAGVEGQDRLACLVFMVGTEILLGAKKAAENGLASEDASEDDQEFFEPGFYTELKEVVDVYKALANALLSEAKAQCEQDKRVPTYNGK